MDEFWKIIRHNQSTTFSIVLVLIALGWAYGCQSKVTSLTHPATKVTRQELQIEIDTFIAQAELRFESLDQQDAFKSALFNMAIEYSKGSTINPLAMAITLGNILGVGLLIDNRRKDVRIKTAKNEIDVLTKTLNNNVTTDKKTN